MTKNVAKTVTELAERMGNAGPPTEDEVTTLLDGRRLDSKEAVEMWLIEVEAADVLGGGQRTWRVTVPILTCLD